jgi:hypothetical protein
MKATRRFLAVAFLASVMVGAGAVSAAEPTAGALAATAAAAADAEPEEFTNDLVILKSELAIEGKVVRKTRDAIYILVEYGVISVPRSKVRSIELNLNSRLSELEEGDFAGRYRLAVTALEEGNASQSKEVLLKLVGKDGVPPEIHRKLAGIYENLGECDKALEHWKSYALARPGDEEAKTKIRELQQKLGKTEPAAAAQPAGGAEAAPAAVAAAGAKPAVVEGLEVGAKWDVLPWGNKATLTTMDLEGNKVLSVEIPGGDTKGKTAVGRAVKLDFSDKSKLTFSGFSAERGRVEVGLALITAADYYESRPVTVRPDWNQGLSIDLQNDKWKCQKTNWRFEARVEKLDDVRQIILLVYCGTTKALLYFDAIAAE